MSCNCSGLQSLLNLIHQKILICLLAMTKNRPLLFLDGNSNQHLRMSSISSNLSPSNNIQQMGDSLTK
ncbi:hypothetical protein E1A91_D07G138500v1 [Gossypium mustelinum]|uniref:Uncharacterized protein n=1 Tax=Gossypium mustelinum TaxID=34275 RepID=A0A5D2U7L5_GOSMU|nr:hypothetical protein E1A91_D07G138500v1 [Gossypium mustelinum]